MTKVLIVDQFSGISPYSLQQHPIKFDDLVTEILALPYNPRSFHFKPEVCDVDDSFVPKMCTTVIRANADGYAEAWKYRWDSSG